MGVLLVRHTENDDDGIDGPHPLLQLAQRPIASIPTVAQPGRDHARFRALDFRQALDGREVAFKIAARDAKAGSKVGMRSDASIELESRSDLGPVRSDLLA